MQIRRKHEWSGHIRIESWRDCDVGSSDNWIQPLTRIVETLVGDFVGAFVGVFVGALVGDAVGFLVGAFVGALVGDFVGFLVGVFVGDLDSWLERSLVASEL